VLQDSSLEIPGLEVKISARIGGGVVGREAACGTNKVNQPFTESRLKGL
jgi:hypothetical protein